MHIAHVSDGFSWLGHNGGGYWAGGAVDPARGLVEGGGVPLEQACRGMWTPV